MEKRKKFALPAPITHGLKVTGNVLKKIGEILKKNMMIVALVIAIVVFEIWISALGKNPLLSSVNITNLINQNGFIIILAIGMLLCILTGGNIDLSVGSQVALISGIAGKLMIEAHVNVYLSVILCLLLGIALGAWQAFWIAYMRIPAFIVTLSGMLLFRGIHRVLLNGLTISIFPQKLINLFGIYLPDYLLPAAETPANEVIRQNTIFMVSLIIGIVICLIFMGIKLFSRISRHKKGYKVEAIWLFIIKSLIVCGVIIFVFIMLGLYKGLPVVLITIGFVALIYHFFTTNTVPGRSLYAMGGNEKAAKLSGVNTNRMLFFAYTNMGFLCAVAALISVVRFNSIDPNRGQNLEMDAIASCFIGGASVTGGVGTISGVIIGAIFMGVLNNGMIIVNIDSNWQAAVKGIVLLLAVILDILFHRRATKA